MAYEHIIFEKDGAIARVTLNRPDKLNSFIAPMHEELADALEQVANDADLRVLVLAGAGRAFSAGQDLSDRYVSGDDGPPDLGASVEKFYAPLVRRLRGLAMPVVCAVNGTAAGAGANVALACDLVVATASAKFTEPFCKLGLIPDTGGSYFLPRLVGTARAMGLAMLGDVLTAEQAADWGLIWKAVPDDDFNSEVDALVQHLADAPTRGLAETKRLIYASGEQPLDAHLDAERDAMRAMGQTSDYREGVAAFMEKRKPTFRGC